MIVEFYLKKRTEEKALIFGPKDSGEGKREEAGMEESQVCILLIHLPVEVPESEGVLDGVEWGAGRWGGMGSLLQPWEETSSHIYLEVFAAQ